MKPDSSANAVVAAAVILVVVPLLATLVTLGAHLGLPLTGAARIDVFPRLGMTQGVLLVWSALAVGIVMALIVEIIGDRLHA
jgi:hypothetical protein